jgi:hypothetical protein
MLHIFKKIGISIDQGRSQKFFEGGTIRFFVWKKIRGGGFSGFFLKNPSKMKKFFRQGGGFVPQTPPPGYAPGLDI